MRLTWLCLSLVTLSVACSHGAESTRMVAVVPGPSPKPVLVMMELNPWLMVIGSDSASFVLYEDGRVIYRERDDRGRSREYKTVLLTDEEKGQLLHELSLDRLDALEPRYETVNATDLPTRTLITWPGGTARSVSVYGFLDTTEAGGMSAMDEFPPPAFVNVYKRLLAFRSPRATAWTPEVVEIMVWPFEHASFARPWPATWPSLKDAAVQPTDEHTGVIYVNGNALPALTTYLRSTGPSEAIEMNGRKMSVALRFVIPGEAQWKKAVPPSH